jgi:hypothetical protein
MQGEARIAAPPTRRKAKWRGRSVHHSEIVIPTAMTDPIRNSLDFDAMDLDPPGGRTQGDGTVFLCENPILIVGERRPEAIIRSPAAG